MEEKTAVNIENSMMAATVRGGVLYCSRGARASWGTTSGHFWSGSMM